MSALLFHQGRINIPNLLTLMRILLIPLLVAAFYLPYHWSHIAAGVLFALAAITDWFDGYLARRLGQMTPFGAFLDPVADKLIVVVALVLLVESYTNIWITLAASIIIAREVAVSALREWMAELGKRASIAVSYLGKIKTCLQMLAITGLLALRPDMTQSLTLMMCTVLMVSAVLTLWSMIIYLKIAWPLFKLDLHQSPSAHD